MKNLFRFSLASFFLFFGFVFIISAQTTAPREFSNIKIENFGQMDEKYYRGSQPEIGDYEGLKELGVKTVIDLRDDPTDYEKREVEALGMRYVNIPMSGWKYPKESDIERFLRLVNDPDSGTVFVHCKAGMHRTGMTGAIYRFTKYGWDFDTAFREMKNYKFYSGFAHETLKLYVKDYFKRGKVQVLNSVAANEPVAAGAN